MSRKLIIDGNAVYEIDEECMLRNRLDNVEAGQKPKMERRGEKISATAGAAQKKDKPQAGRHTVSVIASASTVCSS